MRDRRVTLDLVLIRWSLPIELRHIIVDQYALLLPVMSDPITLEDIRDFQTAPLCEKIRNVFVSDQPFDISLFMTKYDESEINIWPTFRNGVEEMGNIPTPHFFGDQKKETIEFPWPGATINHPDFYLISIKQGSITPENSETFIRTIDSWFRSIVFAFIDD